MFGNVTIDFWPKKCYIRLKSNLSPAIFQYLVWFKHSCPIPNLLLLLVWSRYFGNQYLNLLEEPYFKLHLSRVCGSCHLCIFSTVVILCFVFAAMCGVVLCYWVGMGQLVNQHRSVCSVSVSGFARLIWLLLVLHSLYVVQVNFQDTFYEIAVNLWIPCITCIHDFAFHWIPGPSPTDN